MCAIRECCHNICTGNVDMTDAEFNNLKRHEKLIQRLGNPNTSQRQLQTLAQQGGFLPLLAAILPPVMGAVGSIVSSAVRRGR